MAGDAPVMPSPAPCHSEERKSDEESVTGFWKNEPRVNSGFFGQMPASEWRLDNGQLLKQSRSDFA